MDDKILKEQKYIQINQILFSIVNTYESRLSKEKKINKKALSISEKGILLIIGQFQPLNLRQLSEKMDINTGTISLYVERLVKKLLVERKRDKADRRTWWLYLTEQGKQEYSETRVGSIEYTASIMEILTKQEQEKLYELLIKISKYNNYNW